MADFSGMKAAAGYFAPARFEADVYDCEVRGRIPDGLDGAFYRLHGDWLYPPKFADDASLAADGYISMFRFRDGVVDYRGRYVRTDRFRRQMAARRQLYGYYRNPFTDEPEVRDPENPHRRTTANTTPVILAGKLYATKEDGLPYRIDPNTLETLGEEDFGGAWKSQTFAAHPKFDPATGETIAYGYEASGLASRDVFLAAFGRDGRMLWDMRFDAPYTTMLHDIAISPNHVIIPGSAAMTSVERLRAGKIHWAWEDGKDSWYAVVPRGGRSEDIRWFRGPERSLVHTANAWEEDGKVIVDMPAADGNTWPFFPDVNGAPFSMHPFTLRRVVFDLASDSDTPREEILFDTEITSFTRIDDRFAAQENRYVYVQYVDRTRKFGGGLPDDPRAMATSSYARFDVREGTMTSWFAGESHVLQEPVFVSRHDGAEEGDGWLIGTAHDLAAMRAELVIVDAVSMQEAARVILPFRNAYQVHGAWATARDLPLD